MLCLTIIFFCTAFSYMHFEYWFRTDTFVFSVFGNYVVYMLEFVLLKHYVAVKIWISPQKIFQDLRIIHFNNKVIV
jgi:hypothetical protein